MKNIHPPIGNNLKCKNWQIEAAYRMIQHNLNPEVAEVCRHMLSAVAADAAKNGMPAIQGM